MRNEGRQDYLPFIFFTPDGRISDMSNRKPSKQKDKKKKKKAGISGFSTLNQVAGVPKPREHRSSIPVETPKTITEPHPVCAYCGEEIENIASAFMISDGSYAHFDCVLDRLKAEENPKEGEMISYIGSGNFALIGEDENGKPIILKKLPFENSENTKTMKDYIASLRK